MGQQGHPWACRLATQATARVQARASTSLVRPRRQSQPASATLAGLRLATKRALARRRRRHAVDGRLPLVVEKSAPRRILSLTTGSTAGADRTTPTVGPPMTSTSPIMAEATGRMTATSSARATTGPRPLGARAGSRAPLPLLPVGDHLRLQLTTAPDGLARARQLLPATGVTASARERRLRGRGSRAGGRPPMTTHPRQRGRIGRDRSRRRRRPSPSSSRGRERRPMLRVQQRLFQSVRRGILE